VGAHTFLAIAALFVIFFSPAKADAQAGVFVPVEEPGAYADALSHSITRDGMAPLRTVFGQINNGNMFTPQLEAAIVTFERSMEGHVVDRVAKLDDVTLGGAYRSIYYMHVYETFILFTRCDFIHAGDRGWQLATLSFASSWSQVALPTSAGWRSTNP